MKKNFLFLLLIFVTSSSFCQMKVKDVFASAPDSIFPLLTKNNRLDCIDFIENNMQARVKNKLEQNSELKVLKDDYLMMEISPKSRMEMFVLNDSVLCVVRTYKGPAEDSSILFYSQNWQLLTSVQSPQPKVADFWQSVPDSLQQMARYAQMSQESLRFINIGVKPEEKALVYTLSTDELVDKEKETAQRYVQPLKYRWDGNGFSRVSNP